MTSPSQIRTAPDWQIPVLAFMTFIGLGMADGLLGVAWASIRDQFGREDGAMIEILIAQMIGFLLITFNNGPLTARFGSGRIILTGVIVLICALFGIIIAPTWVVVLAFSFLRGMGQCGIDTGMNTYVATRLSGRVMGWLHASYGVGATISPFIMAQLFEREFSWQSGYVFVAGVLVFVAVALAMTQHLWNTEMPVDSSVNRERRSSLEIWLMPVVLLSAVVFSIYVGHELVVAQWTSTLFSDGRGLTRENAAYLVSLFWGSFTVGRILTGFIADWKPRLILRLSFLGMLIGSVMLWWSPSLPVSYLALVVLGVTQAPVFPLMMTMTPKLVGQENAASAIGFQMGTINIAAALIPGFVGILSQQFTLEVIGPYLIMLALVTFGAYELMLVAGGEKRKRFVQEGL